MRTHTPARAFCTHTHTHTHTHECTHTHTRIEGCQHTDTITNIYAHKWQSNAHADKQQPTQDPRQLDIWWGGDFITFKHWVWKHNNPHDAHKIDLKGDNVSTKCAMHDLLFNKSCYEIGFRWSPSGLYGKYAGQHNEAPDKNIYDTIMCVHSRHSYWGLGWNE